MILEKPSVKEKGRDKEKKQLKSWLKKNTGKAYKLWRKLILLMHDGCLMKGYSTCGGGLHAHHAVVEWGKSTATRYDPWGGIILCGTHHIWNDGIHQTSDREVLEEYIRRLDAVIPLVVQQSIRKTANENKGKVWGYEEVQGLMLELEEMIKEKEYNAEHC